MRPSGSITLVTSPEELDAITSDRPDAEVTVSHDVAVSGQLPEPGDGVS